MTFPIRAADLTLILRNLLPRPRGQTQQLVVQIMTSLIRHVHDFAREVELTHDEWMTGVDVIDSLDQHFTAKSHEAFRLREILGLESYVCEFDGESRRLSNKSAAWWMKSRIRLSLAAVPTLRPRRSSVLFGLQVRHFEKMAPPLFRIQYRLRACATLISPRHTDTRGNYCWVHVSCFAPRSDNIRKTMSATCPMLITEITCTDHA